MIVNNHHIVINKKDNKPFKILQITDLHVGGSFLTRESDKLALSSIKQLVEASQPDLIISTGDNIYPILLFGGTPNNLKSSKMVANLLDSFSIPWTTVYGNHDVETYALYGKEKLSNMYSSYSHSIFKKGPDDIDGQGNQCILIKNKDKLIYCLFLFDSHMYIGGGNFFSGFDHVHENQVLWYEKTLSNLKEEYGDDIKSLAFFHIPCSEYKTAWREFCKGNKEVKFFYGEVGEINDYFGTPKKKSLIFDSFLKNKSTKGIFCGHDHLNTTSIEYKGIRLTYGMSIDFLAYRNIKKYTSQRGATEILIYDNKEFDVKPLELKSLKDGYNINNKYTRE